MRRHRDQGHTIWDVFAGYAREALQRFDDVGPQHPVWSDRPYVVFCYDPPGVRGRVKYIHDNWKKEGFDPILYPFVQTYDGWPLTNTRPRK